MRVAIVGNSGSGKTTLARRVSDRLTCPHIELDSLFHQPNWQAQDPAVFRAEVDAALTADSWVCDGNYATHVDALVRGRADVIVVYDLARGTVMRQVVARTFRRALRREVLWNGNREPMSNFWRWNPERNIMRWAWAQHGMYRQQFADAIASGAWDHAEVVTVRSHADAEAWLAALPQGA